MGDENAIRRPAQEAGPHTSERSASRATLTLHQPGEVSPTGRAWRVIVTVVAQ